jgi:hypothetical protein
MPRGSDKIKFIEGTGMIDNPSTFLRILYNNLRHLELVVLDKQLHYKEDEEDLKLVMDKIGEINGLYARNDC